MLSGLHGCKGSFFGQKSDLKMRFGGIAQRLRHYSGTNITRFCFQPSPFITTERVPVNDQARINSELIEENALSKQKIQDLEQSELERKQAEEALRDSKEQYQFVVENLKEVVFRTDAEGHWTFLNSAWAEVTGFAVEESLGMAFLEYVYPEDQQLNLELFRPLIERKKDYCRHEIRYMNKDGGFRWIEVWARLTLDEKGNATGTAGTLTDITERKLAEEALQKSEEKYRTILENIEEGYHEADLAGNFTFFNDSFERILGYGREELMGMSYKQYSADEENSRNIFHAYNKVYRTG